MPFSTLNLPSLFPSLTWLTFTPHLGSVHSSSIMGSRKPSLAPGLGIISGLPQPSRLWDINSNAFTLMSVWISLLFAVIYICLASLICVLVSFINSEKFSTIVSSCIASVLPFHYGVLIKCLQIFLSTLFPLTL